MTEQIEQSRGNDQKEASIEPTGILQRMRDLLREDWQTMLQIVDEHWQILQKDLQVAREHVERRKRERAERRAAKK